MRRGLVRGSSAFGTLSKFVCLLIVSSLAQFNGFCSTFREVFLLGCIGVQGSSIFEEGRVVFIPLALLSFLTFSLLQNILLLHLTKIS